jgi:hypothetical protein
MAWVVLYRVGATDRCKWNEVLDRFPRKSIAQKYVEDNINFLGSKQVILPAAAYKTIGMPVGWNPEDANTGYVDAMGWWWRHGEPKLPTMTDDFDAPMLLVDQRLIEHVARYLNQVIDMHNDSEAIELHEKLSLALETE